MGFATTTYAQRHIRIQQAFTALPIQAIIDIIDQPAGYYCNIKTNFTSISSGTYFLLSTNILESGSPSASIIS